MININEEDLKILEIIKKITAKDGSVEIKRNKDGKLTVYSVKKHREN